ncbi:hypothetical protein A8L34_05055 [Bacillus sp. FJAT-27264]|uniref:hypothetical protein n=1 Tax=Paenibacillus sp. (strain DSM 101736 / FJAT-27264) TaxID=1850362 RepID=UPI000808135D|nr:hypothetical protein [Bacillus sp. FJAT-27264]OBZ18919.1 hypothetical protein A8L34_05055 [Bacillus sp. FJAT-27264]
MAKFIEVKMEHSSELFNIEIINYIIEFEEKAVLNTGKDFIFTKSAYEQIVGILKYHDFVKSEFNGSTIHINGLDTNNKGVEAFVNVNALGHLFGTWQGELKFKDGTEVESYFSPGAMRDSLQIKQNSLILEPKKFS